VKTIHVRPVRGTTLAENKDEAAEIRERDILPTLAAGKSVAIDFAGIETATQSYVHALIADAIRRHGEASFDLLVFKNCGYGVQHIVRTVFEYTLLSKQQAEGNGGSEQTH
jgi:hypothetical protein